jgi:hypothetical protein
MPTTADLETGYMARGEALLACDAARRLAVETFEAERALQDRWRGDVDRRLRPLLRQFLPRAPGTSCRAVGNFCRAVEG